MRGLMKWTMIAAAAPIYPGTTLAQSSPAPIAQQTNGSIPLLRAKARFERNAPTNRRIIGGDSVKIESQPWQIALVYAVDKNNERAQFCGGSLITSQWVVTAAHCVDRSSQPSQIEVFYGEDDLRTVTPNRARVLSIIPHESWSKVNTQAKEYDIALVQIEPLVAGGKAKPIELIPMDSKVFLSDPDILVAGWGVTELRQEGTNQLQSVLVPYVKRDICTAPASYKASEVATSAFCAGKAGYDSCQGDSGGPATVAIDGKQYLAGIVSWGKGCGLPDKFGVYTSIQSFQTWILNQIETVEGKR